MRSPFHGLQVPLPTWTIKETGHCKHLVRLDPFGTPGQKLDALDNWAADQPKSQALIRQCLFWDFRAGEPSASLTLLEHFQREVRHDTRSIGLMDRSVVCDLFVDFAKRNPYTW
jgi:hypothetical protein